MKLNDFADKVHLFSIRDNALDVFTYPVLSTYPDLKNFLSARLESDRFVLPEFFKYPDQYSLYDCGTYEPVLPDGSNNPYCAHPRPRFVGRLIDFRGDIDGKSSSPNKDL